MIDKQGKNFELVCDYCGNTQDFDTFDEALDFIEDEGWNKTNLDGTWYNLCPECIEELGEG